MIFVFAFVNAALCPEITWGTVVSPSVSNLVYVVQDDLWHMLIAVFFFSPVFCMVFIFLPN